MNVVKILVGQENGCMTPYTISQLELHVDIKSYETLNRDEGLYE